MKKIIVINLLIIFLIDSLVIKVAYGNGEIACSSYKTIIKIVANNFF